MNIDQLIEMLQKVKAEHGNLPVCVASSDDEIYLLSDDIDGFVRNVKPRWTEEWINAVVL